MTNMTFFRNFVYNIGTHGFSIRAQFLGHLETGDPNIKSCKREDDYPKENDLYGDAFYQGLIFMDVAIFCRVRETLSLLDLFYSLIHENKYTRNFIEVII